MPDCLEPLPPFWDSDRLAFFICCGKAICKKCQDKKIEYLDRARDEGTYGREEEHLARCCPLCRTTSPTKDRSIMIMEERLEKGQLQLELHQLLGHKYMFGDEGSVEQNTAKCFDILMSGAEKGDPNCQYLIGHIYQKGTHQPKRLEDAKRWFWAATEQGHAVAELQLAVLAGDEGNDPEFLRRMRGSALKGYAHSCCTLGIAHYQGSCGLPRSREEAKHWFLAASEINGHPRQRPRGPNTISHYCRETRAIMLNTSGK